MKIEIEDYKGHTIYYDDHDDKFVCDVSIEDLGKKVKRGSLNDIRKQIDQYIRDNVDFKPFKLVKTSWGDIEVLDVIAYRSDRKLVVQGKYSKTYLGKNNIDSLHEYDVSLVDEFNKAKKKLDDAIKAYEAKKKEITKKLRLADLSRYDLS